MRTSEGKLILFEVETGQQGEYWPIDARTLLKLGTHTPTAPEGVQVRKPAMPPERVGIPATPAAPIHVATSGKVGRPADPEALPPGYALEHSGAGYYVLTDQGGTTVEGPSKGKFQGRDGAAEGAWAHYLST